MSSVRNFWVFVLMTALWFSLPVYGENCWYKFDDFKYENGFQIKAKEQKTSKFFVDESNHNKEYISRKESFFEFSINTLKMSLTLIAFLATFAIISFISVLIFIVIVICELIKKWFKQV